jgi:histidine triad (HIT) family protein
MDDNLVESCIVCRKQHSEVSVPGGIIFENDLLCISHAQFFGDEKQHYLGHLFVEPKRHVAEIGDLTEAEAREVGYQVSRAAKALMATLGMEHVYSFVIGDGVPHVHVHVIGRYPGAPRAYWGPKVDEWPDAPKGDEEAIAALAERIRAWFKANPE